MQNGELDRHFVRLAGISQIFLPGCWLYKPKGSPNFKSSQN
jgi:hypothetical protein